MCKSDVGTGKTHQIIELLKKQPQSSVFITTRKALAKDIKKRFIDNNLIPIIYNEQKGTLHPYIDKPVVIQLESLERLSNMPIDLLVLDEWLSILEQIDARLGRNQEQILTKLVQLIQSANQVIVMDGNLFDQSGELIKQIRQSDAQWVANEYRPYKDYTINYQRIKPKHYSDFTQHVINQLNNNKRVVSFVSEKRRVSDLIGQVLAQTTLTKDDIKYVIGDDLSQDLLNELVKHKITKDDLLSDFEQVGQCKFLIFNSSITSGVDYSGYNFDISINFAQHNSCNANQITQALFRVRYLNEKNHTIYFQNTISPKNFKCFNLIQPELSQNIVENLKILAKSFVQQSNMNPEQYILQVFRNMDININIIDIQSQQTKDVFTSEGRVNQYISTDTKPEPEIIQFTQLQTQLLKDQFITDGHLNHIQHANLKVNDYYQQLKLNKALESFEQYIQLPDNYKELNINKIDVIIEEIKAWKRLFKYSENPTSLTLNHLSKIHKKEFDQYLKSRNQILTNKLTLDQIKDNQKIELQVLEQAQKNEPTLFKNSEAITVEQVKQIKDICRIINKCKANVTKICLDLNIPDLKVDTIQSNIKVIKKYLIEKGKLTE